MAVTQSVRAFSLHAEGRLFESQPRQKTGSDSSIAKHLAIFVSVTGPREPLWTDVAVTVSVAH